MVATRRSRQSAVAPDDNRIIAVVTGANSGFGLGICHQLLSNLSLPPDTPIPASVPQLSALAPSQQALLESPPGSTQSIPSLDPPALTLILACRSKRKADEARDILLAQHEIELAQRAKAGIPARNGWKEGLQIVWEGVDFDAVGTPTGTLAFCERLKANYPHITSLFINAGLGAYKGNDYLGFAKQFFTMGFVATLTDPLFQIEIPGARSADGERGLVWGINVLAPYILIKELSSLLERSPSSLPLPPRIVYTSSSTAYLKYLHPDPLDDYQLLTYGTSHEDAVYKASKYCGDLVMVQMDRQLALATPKGKTPVRVLPVDPGNVATNIFDAGFGTIKIYREVMKFFYWLSFYLVSNIYLDDPDGQARLLGSPLHTVYATQSALAMLYAALVDERFLMPVEKVPAQKFKVHAGRWGKTKVDYGEVDHWEDTSDIGAGMVRACETVRAEWKRREGLE